KEQAAHEQTIKQQRDAMTKETVKLREALAKEKAQAKETLERELRDARAAEEQSLADMEARKSDLEDAVQKLKRQERSTIEYLQMLNRQKRDLEGS
ncbi:MAG: hypothetical protein AAGJ31_12315, partial [Verrucomicrobiota bacterium]